MSADSEMLREGEGRSSAETVAGYLSSIAIFVAVIGLAWHPIRLILPAGAFLEASGGDYVFVLDGHSAHRRRVKLGRRNPDFVEVVEGLKPGEKVIVSGYDAYQKMDRIEFDTRNSNS